jgi:hypothetical protein
LSGIAAAIKKFGSNLGRPNFSFVLVRRASTAYEIDGKSLFFNWRSSVEKENWPLIDADERR